MNCLKCKQSFDDSADACPHCGDRVTDFQRTYATRLLDGKYEILDRLGVGGMGEIFKVRHVHLGEQRVVKIMRSNIAADEEALQRFLHEARLATMIKHRSLAMLYDFSLLDDGSYYMVWEFIDGTNIQKWTATNGPMPARVAMEISIQALAGLEALHQMGVIHRDISPENIMITQDYQEKLLVKVIDFGIAKQLSEGESGQGLTQTGMFLGKLKYASPEQAGFIKEGEKLDARSDLYSFGIVLYEMLAGRAPFMATNPQSYILKHATEKPLPIAQVNPEVKVPARLEQVVFKSLEKDRTLRHEGAAEFIRDLVALRDEVAPDAKYGLGEKLVTIASAKTLQDLHPFPTTGRTQAKTTAGRTVAGPGRAPARDEATIVERTGTLGGDSATVVESIGGAEATVAEQRLGPADATRVERKSTMVGGAPGAAGAEATVVERKAMPGEAAATVIERLARPEEKKKTGLIAAIAAVVVLAIAAGAWFVLRPKPEPAGVVETSTAIDVPSTGGGDTALGPNQGALLLTSTPYGELERIINQQTRQPITLSHLEDRSVPLRVPLEAGVYEVTLSDRQGNHKTEVATIEAGDVERIHARFRQPDLDKLVEEILNQ
ncbi:MAG TPA: serine/threonine-protein kinase [Thermoanaerobaculia bacterium]|nr:serine/threonine-protein kinase [Thermoanaerobaculia bacterium]